MNILDIIESNGLKTGRLITWSKGDYKQKNPGNVCYFNANICTLEEGKVWFGDLDLTISGGVLKSIADNIGKQLYVLREMDCRFEDENISEIEIIKKSVWNTQNN